MKADQHTRLFARLVLLITKGSSMQRLSVRTHLVHVALASVASLVLFRVIILIFGRQYKLSVDAAQGVLIGEPHWRVFQSRLLGPYLVEAASVVFDTFLKAHVFCSVVLLALAGYLMLVRLTHLYRDSIRALLGYSVFFFLFVFCVNSPWLYIWDLVDVVLFVLFCDFVAHRRDYRFFVALFVVAVFNRQSAFYIALWMMIDPLVKSVLDRARGLRGGRFDFKMAVSGVVLLGAGVALVEYLQSTLLVREVGPSLVGQVEGAGPRFHFLLLDNLSRLWKALISFRVAMSFLIPLFIVFYLAFCGWVASRNPRANLGVATVHALLLASTVVFVFAFETRVYLVLLPFVAFNLWPIASDDAS